MSGICGECPRPCGPGVYTCYPSLGSAVSSSFMRCRLSSSERLRNLLQVTRLASRGAGADSTLHMVNTNRPQEGRTQIGEAPGIQTRLLSPPNLLVSPLRSFSERLSHPWLLQAMNTYWACKCVRELLMNGKGNGGGGSLGGLGLRSHAPRPPRSLPFVSARQPKAPQTHLQSAVGSGACCAEGDRRASARGRPRELTGGSGVVVGDSGQGWDVGLRSGLGVGGKRRRSCDGNLNSYLQGGRRE